VVDRPETDMTTDDMTAAGEGLLLASQRVDCHHSGPSGHALLSRHRTSAGAVSYLRCSCGAWLVLQEDELSAVVTRSTGCVAHGS
jgi:hypothetical protein